MMPVAPLWSILFFLMLFMLGADSQFAMVETVVTSVVDEFPALGGRKQKIAVNGFFCVAMFLLGLPQCSSVNTHLVWPYQPENPPGRPRAWLTSPRRSPSLFPLYCSTTL